MEIAVLLPLALVIMLILLTFGTIVAAFMLVFKVIGFTLHVAGRTVSGVARTLGLVVRALFHSGSWAAGGPRHSHTRWHLQHAAGRRRHRNERVAPLRPVVHSAGSPSSGLAGHTRFSIARAATLAVSGVALMFVGVASFAGVRMQRTTCPQVSVRHEHHPASVTTAWRPAPILVAASSSLASTAVAESQHESHRNVSPHRGAKIETSSWTRFANGSLYLNQQAGGLGVTWLMFAGVLVPGFVVVCALTWSVLRHRPPATRRSLVATSAALWLGAMGTTFAVIHFNDQPTNHHSRMGVGHAQAAPTVTTLEDVDWRAETPRVHPSYDETFPSPQRDATPATSSLTQPRSIAVYRRMSDRPIEDATTRPEWVTEQGGQRPLGNDVPRAYSSGRFATIDEAEHDVITQVSDDLRAQFSPPAPPDWRLTSQDVRSHNIVQQRVAETYDFEISPNVTEPMYRVHWLISMPPTVEQSFEREFRASEARTRMVTFGSVFGGLTLLLTGLAGFLRRGRYKTVA